MSYRSKGYYDKKFGMNILQQEAHKQACRRTVAYFKDSNMKVTVSSIEQILRALHVYVRNVVHNMHKWTGKDDPDLVYLPFGYIHTIPVKMLHNMYLNGEFTDQEWEVIITEFYKKEFDIYFRLLKNRAIWKQQRKRRKLKPTSKEPMASK